MKWSFNTLFMVVTSDPVRQAGLFFCLQQNLYLGSDLCFLEPQVKIEERIPYLIFKYK
jgi:hypothetical protein